MSAQWGLESARGHASQIICESVSTKLEQEW